MADGELTLRLDDETARRLQEAADAAGVAVEAYAAEAIARALTDASEDVTEDLRRHAEYRRTGQSLSVEEAMKIFDDELERRSAGGA